MRVAGTRAARTRATGAAAAAAASAMTPAAAAVDASCRLVDAAQPHSKGGWTAGPPRSEGGGEGFAGGLGDLKATDARDTLTRNGTPFGILLVVPSALLCSQSFHLQASWRARLFETRSPRTEVADCLLLRSPVRCE